jgi:hypothetical protein
MKLDYCLFFSVIFAVGLVYSLSWSSIPCSCVKAYGLADNVKLATNSTISQPKIASFGAWTSNQFPLESLTNHNDKIMAIDLLLKQGYKEYFFVLKDYKSESNRSQIVSLLDAADYTTLKMIPILLPPSEGGKSGNYDWEGWIKYLNLLKSSHHSLYGFVIDDFNWFSTSEGKDKKDDGPEGTQKIQENVKFMIKSKLDRALQNKRNDLNFFPTVYFEGLGTNDVKKYFYDYSDGIVLASSNYYSVADLQHNLYTFSKVFYKKPLKFVLYTAKTSNFAEQGYDPPSDRLILATLSIANKTKGIDEIVIWRNTNSHVIRDYLSNINDKQFLSFVSLMEKLQLKDEAQFNSPELSSSILSSQKSKSENHEDDNSGVYLASLTPWLGVSVTGLSPSTSEEMGLPEHTKGILIQSVVSNSPAERAGLKGAILDVDSNGYLTRKGDIIISADGKEIEKPSDLTKQVEAKKPGDPITLGININGNVVFKAVRLGSLPGY